MKKNFLFSLLSLVLTSFLIIGCGGGGSGDGDSDKNCPYIGSWQLSWSVHDFNYKGRIIVDIDKYGNCTGVLYNSSVSESYSITGNCNNHGAFTIAFQAGGKTHRINGRASLSNANLVINDARYIVDDYFHDCTCSPSTPQIVNLNAGDYAGNWSEPISTRSGIIYLTIASNGVMSGTMTETAHDDYSCDIIGMVNNANTFTFSITIEVGIVHRITGSYYKIGNNIHGDYNYENLLDGVPHASSHGTFEIAPR